MSEAKFTKGPWVVYECDDCHGRQDYDSLVIGMDSFNEMPSCYSSIHRIEIPCALGDEEGEANAHLIAQAPAMYEMLESASNELYALINEVNKLRMTKVHSQTETPPDLHDMETCYLIGKLLAAARGEKCE